MGNIMKKNKLVKACAVAFVLVGASTAHATSGFFPLAKGSAAGGMAGASTAMIEDSFGGANNPAAMVFVGNRFDIEADLFKPVRSASSSGGAGTGAPFDTHGEVRSNNEFFVIPSFGYNRMIDSNKSVGVTFYANGGMNTEYPASSNATQNGAGFGFGQGKLGGDLMQAVLAPTFAIKPTDNQSVGISVLMAYQQFKAYGIGNFAGYSVAGAALSDNGKENSIGLGVRLGYLGKLNSQWTVGASYSPKISMSKFEKYKGLFAGSGSFDIPENYTLGLAFKPIEKMTLALDYQRINYAGVPALGNPQSNLMLPQGAGLLGAASGAAFGWANTNVYKFGLQYDYSTTWTWRAGYSKNNNPVSAANVQFNIIAPAVITDHATLGATYRMDKSNEFHFSLMHAFNNSVSASGMNGQAISIKMHEDQLGFGYSYKF
jgi:long-chain fatty acid transport protein